MSVRVQNAGNDGQAASGSEQVGFGKLEGYRIEISDDGKDWTKYKPVMIGAKANLVYSYSEKDMKVTTSTTGATAGVVDFRHTDLVQNTKKYYRVSTVNNAPGSLMYSEATDIENATTHKSLTSDDPGGLVAKANGSAMIDLVWNARADDIAAAEVDGYKIESSPLNAKGECAETWSVLEANTKSTTTAYTHDGLAPSTGVCYRVFGLNAVGGSTSYVGFGDAYSTTNDNDAIATTMANSAPAAGTAPTVAPITAGMTGTAQSSLSDADAGDTLTWTATVMPADGSIATAAVDNMGMVTITAVAAGSATITVTLTDAAMASASEDIMVTVVAANVAPTPKGTVPAQAVKDGGAMQTATVDASMYFEDAGDTLTFTATSDDGHHCHRQR